MEKRTFLAIILSLMVIVFYNSITPKTPPQPPTKSSQTIVNKIFAEPSLLKEPPAIITLDKKIPSNSLESDSILLKISSIGSQVTQITTKNPLFSPPLSIPFIPTEYKNFNFSTLKKADKTITFVYETEDFILEKFYEATDSFIFNTSVRIKNKTKMSKQINLDILLIHIETSSLDNDKSLMTERGLFEYSIATPLEIIRKNNAIKFNQKEAVRENKTINWIGYRTRYFCTILKPEFEMNSYYVNPIDEHNLEIGGGIKVTLYPEETKVLSAYIYNGPQDINILKKFNVGFEGIINFKIGGFMDLMAFGLIDFIGKGILYILNFLHNIVKNWGLSIILLGIIIYSATYPLTAKSMASMKKMQLLQPEIAKIKEQNKNNPQKLNKDIMELYKKHNFNPFGGCLPLFFQMPVFIALYQVLWRTYYIKGADFLWIKDLALPDRLVILPFSLPFLGNELNILPFIVMITMFIQQKITASMSVVTDPDQLMQQKIMGTVMPVMIGVVFYKVASGLALYFATFYILSTLTQLKIKKATIG